MNKQRKNWKFSEIADDVNVKGRAETGDDVTVKARTAASDKANEVLLVLYAHEPAALS